MIIICHADELDESIKSRIGDIDLIVITEEDTLEVLASVSEDMVGETDENSIISYIRECRLP